MQERGEADGDEEPAEGGEVGRQDEVFALDTTYLERSISAQIAEQVWVTTSGMFTLPPFVCALMTFGIDRLMFSVDYPFSANEPAKAFFDKLERELWPGSIAEFNAYIKAEGDQMGEDIRRLKISPLD